MAEGSTDVAPATGLADGQEVRVTGTDLMPSYAGQQLGPWPTGGWAIVQCDAAITGGVSLYNAFDLCAGPPIARPLRGPAHRQGGHDRRLDGRRAGHGRLVVRDLPRTPGGLTAPGACVVGLYRFEQDGPSTGHFTPVTFGPG